MRSRTWTGSSACGSTSTTCRGSQLSDMRRRILILSVWTLLSPLIGLPSGNAGEPGENKWGPFRGQIIDVDTGQPILGAVALAIWLETLRTPVQANQKFYDARVAVTGTEGRFEIPRRPPPFFSTRIDTPLIEYFAPGYVLAEPLANPSDPGIVRLRKWGMATPEQRLHHDITSGKDVWVPKEDRSRLIATVNADRRRMSLHPIRMLHGGPE